MDDKESLLGREEESGEGENAGTNPDSHNPGSHAVFGIANLQWPDDGFVTETRKPWFEDRKKTMDRFCLPDILLSILMALYSFFLFILKKKVDRKERGK